MQKMKSRVYENVNKEKDLRDKQSLIEKLEYE
jgi:hypothetical protein